MEKASLKSLDNLLKLLIQRYFGASKSSLQKPPIKIPAPPSTGISQQKPPPSTSLKN